MSRHCWAEYTYPAPAAPAVLHENARSCTMLQTCMDRMRILSMHVCICTQLYILNEHNEILLMLIQSLHLGSYWLPVSKGAKDKIKRRERPPDRSLGAPRPLVREYWLIFCNFAASFCLSDSPGKRGPDNSPGGDAFLISVFIPIRGFTT